MRKIVAIISISFGVFLPAACNDSGFSGGDSNRQPPETEVLGPQDDLAAQPDQMENCIEGDVANLKFPEPIQSCLDSGRLFDFSKQECLPVEVASFACSFDEMAAAVDAIGVSNGSVLSARDEGALLVSCGEKNAGNTIVAQWFYPLADQDVCQDVEAVSQRIVTACYKLYPAGQAPPNETEEDKRLILESCLQE